MEINLTNASGELSDENSVTLSEGVFNCEFNETLVHQLVTTYMAGARAGTKAQKTRSEVSGGGAKPWKQKGTGRARAGTSRSPIWRSGGVTFAAKPRDYTKKLNKKMYRKAMRSIWSELIRQGRLLIVEDFLVNSHKTKEVVDKLGKLGLSNALIVNADVSGDLYLATRNLYDFDVRDVTGVDPVSLIGFDKVLITLPAIKQIEERLKNE